MMTNRSTLEALIFLQDISLFSTTIVTENDKLFMHVCNSDTDWVYHADDNESKDCADTCLQNVTVLHDVLFFCRF